MINQTATSVFITSKKWPAVKIAMLQQMGNLEKLILTTTLNQEGEEIDILDQLEDETARLNGDEVFQSQVSDQIYSCLGTLKPKHRLVIIRRYGLDGSPVSTQQEIAHHLNLSRARVTLIEKEAIEKLRRIMAGRGLDELLTTTNEP